MRRILACSVLAIILSGCATAPTGPRVAVMPAPGKPFEVFVAEDNLCRRYAEQSIGQSRNKAAAENFAGAAAVGTAVGAAAGSLSGGEGSTGGGAATGLVVGSMIGAGESANASGDAQRRYDIAYEQCMYAKGNQIPGAPQPRYYPPPRPH
ncbi:MAG: hypothetical protein ACM3W8_03715 [Sideroxydans sp.]|nr:hypothetical protein [Sideroxyarcus sp.]